MIADVSINSATWKKFVQANHDEEFKTLLAYEKWVQYFNSSNCKNEEYFLNFS